MRHILLKGFTWDALKMSAIDVPEAAVLINPAAGKCEWL
jgi:hypothetical protein